MGLGLGTEGEGAPALNSVLPPDWTGVQVDNSTALVLGVWYTITVICIFTLQVGADSVWGGEGQRGGGRSGGRACGAAAPAAEVEL